MMKRTMSYSASILFVGFGFGAVAMGLGGCVSYTNVPVPESAPAFKSMNHTQSITVVARALEAVLSEHQYRDDEGHYAINLPMGTTPESAQKIIDRLPEGAIVPFEGMDHTMPMYSIGRIWIRASDAKVDVVYPYMRADGRSEDQSVTIWLNGGVRKWRVNRMQHWAPGTIPTPPISVPIVPEEQTIDEPTPVAGETEEPVESDSEPISEPTGNGYQEIPVHD